jgi:LysR family hydrogen peroxide-inducible transcriptional activator
MVAAGFGICFIPEFSPTIPSVLTRVVADPEVVRQASLVSIAGRRFSPAVAAFARNPGVQVAGGGGEGSPCC